MAESYARDTHPLIFYAADQRTKLSKVARAAFDTFERGSIVHEPLTRDDVLDAYSRCSCDRRSTPWARPRARASPLLQARAGLLPILI